MLGIEVRYKGAFPKLKKSVWNKQVSIPTIREALEHWHGKFRAKHFTEEGAREYKYAARKGQNIPRGTKKFNRSYVGRKLAKTGHMRPLVFSGVTERLARVRDIRVNSKRGRAILPPGLNRKHPKSRIRMRDEATRVSSREEATLERIADRSVTAKLNAINTTERKKLA